MADPDILQQYLLESANAVSKVAKSIESISDMTPYDAQLSSAVLLGLPKPSAANVSSLVSFKKREMPTGALPPDVLEAVSITRFAQEYNTRRVESAMREIIEYINELPVPGNSSISPFGCFSVRNGARKGILDDMRERITVGVGLSYSGEPVVDRTKYETGSTSSMGTQSVRTLQETDMDENEAIDILKGMFSLLGMSEKDIVELKNKTKNSKVLSIAMKWARSVENQILSAANTSSEQTLTQSHMTGAMNGLYDMNRILRCSLYRSASQLSTEGEISAVQKAMKNCMALLSANAMEQTISTLLFYACFKVENTPEEMIAREAKQINKIKILARHPTEVFTSLCFFLQSFHVSCTEALMSVGSPMYVQYTENIIRNLLMDYSSCAASTHWENLNALLAKRREIHGKSTNLRKDILDCRVNLSSPMYIVIYDALGFVKGFIDSLNNFLVDVKNKQDLLDRFYNVRNRNQ